MYFIKTSLWLFLTLSSVYISECNLSHLFQKYLIQNAPARKTHDEHKDNCFCFKNTGGYHKVPEMLTKNGEHLERHVIYLYREKTTDQIKMYVPNDEKQALVPDLAFEVGDKLVTVEDEKVRDILDRVRNPIADHHLQSHESTNPAPSSEINSPDEHHELADMDIHQVLETDRNKSGEYLDNDHVIEYVTDTDKVNSKEINIPYDNITPDDTKEIITSADHSIHFPEPEEPLNTFLDGQPGGNWNILPEFNYHEQHGPLNFNTNFSPLKLNIPTGVIDFKHDEQGMPSHTSESSFTIPGSDWNVLPEYNHPIDHHSHGEKKHRYHTKDGDEITIHSHEHSKPGQPGKSEEEMKLSPETLTSTEESKEKYIESLEDGSVDKDTINKKPESNEESSSSVNQEPQLGEKESSNEIEYSKHTESNDVNNETDKIRSILNHNEYTTFDRWFIQQMLRFKTYTEHDRAVDLATIERYIIKILHDNDMYVTTEGVLTDSFGTALDIHNLHLRPILIGNPLAFGSLMNEEATGLVIPANMAYLQAILVTNANPSMILGIIPIGKTVIPPSLNAFTTLLKPHVEYSWSNPAKYHSKNVKIQKFPRFEKKPMVLHLSKTRPVGYGLRKHGKTIFTVIKKTPVIVKSIHRHRHRQPVNTMKVFKGNREYRFHADNSVEAVNNLILSLRRSQDNSQLNSEEATNKLLKALRNGSSDSLLEKNGEVVSIDDEDIEGRIVGGSAATGSGTPLSMKGRMKDS